MTENQLQELEKIILTKEGNITGYFCHVNSPIDFFIQKEEYVDQLHNLTTKMRSIYADHKEKCKFESKNVQIGRICAAIYPKDSCLYRARITGLPKKNVVEVTFVDFGNTALLRSLDDIFYLLPKFCLLPELAIPCRVSNYDPSNLKVEERFRTFLENNTKVKFEIGKYEGEQYFVHIFANEINSDLIGQNYNKPPLETNTEPQMRGQKILLQEKEEQNPSLLTKKASSPSAIKLLRVLKQRNIVSNQNGPKVNSDISNGEILDIELNSFTSATFASGQDPNFSPTIKANVEVKNIYFGSSEIHAVNYNSTWCFMRHEFNLLILSKNEVTRCKIKTKLADVKDLWVFTIQGCPPLLKEFFADLNGSHLIQLCAASEIIKSLGEPRLLIKELNLENSFSPNKSFEKSISSCSDLNTSSSNINGLIAKHEADVHFLRSLTFRRSINIKNVLAGIIDKNTFEDEWQANDRQIASIVKQISQVEQRLVELL